MTLQQAAQLSIDCQNASNASGLIRSLHEITSEVLWPEAQRLGKGTRWVNRHPIIALFLYKIGELNGRDITSLMDGYDSAMAEVIELTDPAACPQCGVNASHSHHTGSVHGPQD